MEYQFARNLIAAFLSIAVTMSCSERVTDKEGFNWLDHMVYSWSTVVLTEGMDMDTNQGKD